jgi:hypothetical protein
VHTTRRASLCYRVATCNKRTGGFDDRKHPIEGTTERGHVINIYRYYTGADALSKLSYPPRHASADHAVDVGVRRQRRAYMSAARVIA